MNEQLRCFDGASRSSPPSEDKIKISELIFATLDFYLVPRASRPQADLAAFSN